MAAGSTLRGKDYAGRDVLVQARRVADSPWYVVAKVSSSEVAEPTIRLALELTFILALLLLGTAAGVADQLAREAPSRCSWFAGLGRCGRARGADARATLQQVDAGGGRKENYSVELALRSPWVTATEIKNLMNNYGRA